MSILYEILIAAVFSALLSPQTEVKETQPEKVKTEKVSTTPSQDCNTKKIEKI
ncbi:hypothetical protein [Salinimicrobium gaetbulicola]|uniref:Uncharacterized protein n=1 Tax=Salinimicrobium gaetbulicola TaxID=999702 RepID=A0ABW3IDP5_9FLAO